MFRHKSLFGITSIAMALLVLASAPAFAADAPEWTLDPAHSTISFSIRHIMSQVSGTFDRFRGSVRFDPENLSGSKVAIEIPVASVNTRNSQRDGHLQTADFFDAASFPNMSFVGDTFIRTGEGRYSVVGRLTIKNVTRRVVLPFEYRGVVDHPMKKDHVVTGTRITLNVLRSDFGVGTGSYAETVMIGDEVSIVIDIEAFRPKAAASPASTRPVAVRPAEAPSTRPAR